MSPRKPSKWHPPGPKLKKVTMPRSYYILNAPPSKNPGRSDVKSWNTCLMPPRKPSKWHPSGPKLKKAAMSRCSHILNAHPSPISDRSEVIFLKTRYSGHLSSRLACFGPNATKQTAFPYTWKESENETCSIGHYKPVLKLFVPFSNLWMKYLSKVVGQMGHTLNVNSSLWMNTSSFIMKWTIP
jgi:hypothetical protein